MSKKKPLTKRQACIIHFKRRMRERYHISCNRFLIKEIIEVAKKSPHLIDLSCNRYIFLFKYKDIEIPVAFDVKRACPVTALYLIDFDILKERAEAIKEERYLLEEGRYDLLEDISI